MNEPILEQASDMEKCTVISFSHYLPRQEIQNQGPRRDARIFSPRSASWWIPPCTA